MQKHSSTLAACLLVVFGLLGACSDIPASNPYDPSTPAAQQATASIVGRLVLPQDFDATNFGGARVALSTQLDPAAEPRLAELTPAETAEHRSALAFSFPELPAGPFLLNVSVGTFQLLRDGQSLTPLPVTLVVGRRLDLGDLPLTVPPVTSRGGLQGIARLEGATRHGGITVELRGTPYATTTTAEGRYAVDVPAGTYDVDFTATGYASSTAHVTVDEGQVAQVPDQILGGQPGELTGHMSLSAGAEGLGDVTRAVVELHPADAAQDASPLQFVAPGADGRFRLSGVVVGDYRVRLSLDGFAAATRFTRVEIGERVDVGEVTLEPLDQLASVEGVARIAGAPDDGHGGIVVEVAGTHFATVTASDGQYLLAVPPDADGFTVNFGKSGYNTLPVPVDGLARDEHRVLAPVTLSGRPGSIAGVVAVPPDWPEPEVISQASVVLFAAALEPGAPACAGDADCAAPNLCFAAVCRPPRDRGGVGADGGYIFVGVSAGDYSVVARLDGFHDTAEPVRVRVGEDFLAAPILLSPLPATATIEGTAQLFGAAVHEGIAVTVVGLPIETHTTIEGLFSVSVPLERQGYTLHFEKAGYDAQTEVVRALAPGETYTLPTPVVLTGQPGLIRFIVELPPEFADNPNLIDQGEVQLSLFGPEGLSQVRSLALPHDGIVTLDGLAAGSYVIRVVHPTFDPAFRSVELTVGETADLGLVHLTAAGQSQRGLVRGRVDLGCPGPCDQGGVRVEAALTPFVTFTSQDGAFELEATENVYSLVFHAPGYNEARLPEVPVLAQSVTALENPVPLVAMPTGVRGRVTHETAGGDFVAAPGATVTLLSEGSTLQVAQTPGDGTFNLAAPGEGPYDVRFELADHRTMVRPVRCRGGEVLDVGDVGLILARGSVSGRASVGAAAGPLPAGATLRLTGHPRDPNAAGVVATAQAVPADGTFVFARLAPGDYDLVAVGPGLRPSDVQAVAVLANADTVANVRLEPRQNTLTVAPYAPAVASVSVHHDDDLGFVRFWLDQETAPEGTPFVALPAANPGTLAVPLPADGPHHLYVQLADAKATNADPADDLLATIAPALRADVVRDTSPPVVYGVLVDGGDGYVRDVRGDVEAEITCVDEQSAAGALRVRIRRDAQVLFDGPWQPMLRFNLGVDEGPVALEVTCTDAAGLVSVPYPVDLVHDRTPPVISAFTLLDGGDGAATASSLVTATLTATDDTSGVVSMRLSLDPQLDCAGAGYADAYQRSPSLALPGVDAPYVAFACVRDAAGNTSLRAASNRVVRDTVAPSAPTVDLARGAPVVRVPIVELSVGGGPDVVSTVIVGDVAEAGTYGPGARPRQVTLLEPDGPHVVTAILRDAAGNESPPASALVELDRVAPADGTVTLADGATHLHDRSVPVTIADTVADSMAFTEVAVGAACPDPACGSVGYGPFSPATSITLSPGQGPKRVCWKFCDSAGNGSHRAGADVVLDSYLARPRPVLDASAPRSLTPFSCTSPALDRPTLTLTGHGFAADTVAQVGAYLLPCVSVGAEACQADPDGHCGALCEQTCATSCTVEIPDYVMGVSTSHVLRALTPAPVFGGDGASDAFKVLDIRSAPPQIWFLSREGVDQPTVEDAYPGEVLELEVTGCGFMENTQFQLGPNGGIATEIVRDPANPSIATAHVTVDTAAIAPAAAPADLLATNLPPGGGVAQAPFGINYPDVTSILGVTLPMGRTATPLGGGPTRAQQFSELRVDGCCAMLWPGGDAITVDDGPNHRMMARFPRRANGGLLPLTSVPGDGYRIEQTDTPGPYFARAATYVGGETGRGLFGLDDHPLTVPPGATTLTVADRGTHRDDLVSSGPGAGDRWFAMNPDAGTFFSSGPAGDAHAGRYVEHAFPDMNGDGISDKVWWSDLGMREAFGLGAIGEAVPFDIPTPRPIDAATIAETDGDAIPDAVIASGAELSVRRGRVDGHISGTASVTGHLAAGQARWIEVGRVTGSAFPDVIATTTADTLEVHRQTGAPGAARLVLSQSIAAPGCAHFVVADLDGDGLGDVAAACVTQHRALVWFNHGDGTLGAPVALDTVTTPYRVAAADMNADALVDLVISTGHGESVFALWHADTRTYELQPRLGPSVQAAELPSQTIPLDINGDGIMDTATLTSDVLSVLLFSGGLGAGGLQILRFPNEFVTAAVGVDITGDGYPELLSFNGSSLAFRLATVDGVSDSPALTIAYPNGGIDLIAGDLNGDGGADIFIGGGDEAIHARNTDGHGHVFPEASILMPPRFVPYRLYLPTPPPGGERTLFATGWQRGAGPLSQLVPVRWSAVNQRYDAYPAEDLGAPATAVAFADFDEDGLLDAATATTVPGRVTIRLQQPNVLPWLVRPDLQAVAGTLFAIAAGDVDEDGHADLAVEVGQPGTLTIFRGRGNGQFGPPAVVEGSSTADNVFLVDMNGDGHLDLVRTFSDGYQVRSGRGDGTFETPMTFASRITGLVRAGLLDLGQDALMDVLAIGDSTGAIELFKRPASRPWAQELTDRALPARSLARGHTEIPLHQGRQSLDQLSVRVRLEGSALDRLTLVLRSPRGDVIALDDGAGRGAATIWQATYPAIPTVGDLSDAYGWQPEGDWMLLIDNVGAVATLTDFTVLTHGRFEE